MLFTAQLTQCVKGISNYLRPKDCKISFGWLLVTCKIYTLLENIRVFNFTNEVDNDRPCNSAGRKSNYIYTFPLSNKKIGWVEDILFIDIKKFHDYQDMYICTQGRSKAEHSGEERGANVLIFNKVRAKTAKGLFFFGAILPTFTKIWVGGTVCLITDPQFV